MPGVVIDVRAEAGGAVTAGDILVVLEAMKMEHYLRAPVDGIVTELRVGAGDQVTMGDLLLVLVEREDERPDADGARTDG